MKKITVACAALSGRIYAGRVNAAGTAFLDGKQDVTSDVLKAVIDKVKPGVVETVTVSGVPTFEIEVRNIKGTVPAPKWVVHVLGPDDVVDCEGELDALRKANELNHQYAAFLAADPSPNNPHCIAVAKPV